MTLSIPQLENIVGRYLQATSDEEQSGCNKILNEWRNSNESNITSLEIIQGKTNDLRLVMYVSYSLIDRMWNSRSFDEEYCINLFKVCFQQIQNQQNILPISSYIRNLINLASLASFFSKDIRLFEEFQKLSPNILIYYFDDIINKEYHEYQVSISQDITQLKPYQYIDANSNIELFYSTVSKAQVCEQTFLFLKTLARFSKISEFNQYLHLFEIGLQEVNCAQSILTFFEAEIAGLNCDYLDEGDIDFVKKLILLLINFSEKFEDLKLSSYVWCQIIDMNFDFYGTPEVGAEYTKVVFTHFINCLSYFIKEDIEEFYVLTYFYTECLCYVPEDSTEMVAQLIEEFIKFIMYLVDNDLRFCNKEISDQLTKLFDDKSYEESDAISDDIDSDTENEEETNDDEFNEYTKFLSRFMGNNIENFSQGYVYVFAYASKKITKMLSSNLAFKITSSQNPPPTTVYFVMNCCQYASESIDNLIDIVIANLNVVNTKDVGEALNAYATKYTHNFIQKSETLLPIIIEVIKNSEAEITVPYFISLFTFLGQFTENTDNVQNLFNNAGGYFLGHVTNPINSIEILQKNVTFLKGVIQSVNPGESQLMKSFVNSLFEQLTRIFTPFMTDLDPAVQECMCQFVKTALHSNWVADRVKVLEWIQDAMLLSANYEQFKVLIKLADLLPSEKFNAFLAQTNQMPYEIVLGEVRFFLSAFKKNKNLVLQLPVQLMLFFLRNRNMLKDSLKLLKLIIQSPEASFSEGDLKLLIEALFNCLLFNALPEDKGASLELLKLIAVRYMTLEAMFQQILAIAGQSDNDKIQEFATYFMDPNNFDYNFSIYAADAIFKIYRTNHPLQQT